MIIIVAIQTCFCFMTISPELFNQFNRLVDLAVVTNIMPYLLSMAAVGVIMKAANVEPAKAKLYTFVALIGALYSFYALFSTGITEVFYGSLATFFGWTLGAFWQHALSAIKIKLSQQIFKGLSARQSFFI